MIFAVAELASDRQPLSTRWYDKKTKETALGIMQILPKTAEWLVRYQIHVLIFSSSLLTISFSAGFILAC
jgi:soluble lytic murein transglycosylase-like protein